MGREVSMGCGCGKAKKAMASIRHRPPEEQAAMAPFTFLTMRGWRPAGGGLWAHDETRLTAAEAIASELTSGAEPGAETEAGATMAQIETAELPEGKGI